MLRVIKKTLRLSEKELYIHIIKRHDTLTEHSPQATCLW